MEPTTVIKKLAGTADYLIEGISIDEIEEIMANSNYERCCECEVWCEAGELVDENSDPCPCSNCRGNNG